MLWREESPCQRPRLAVLSQNLAKPCRPKYHDHASARLDGQPVPHIQVVSIGKPAPPHVFGYLAAVPVPIPDTLRDRTGVHPVARLVVPVRHIQARIRLAAATRVVLAPLEIHRVDVESMSQPSTPFRRIVVPRSGRLNAG